MNKKLHRIAFWLILVGLTVVRGFGQASPAVVVSPRYEGFQLPTLQGSLNYAFSVSERVDRGYSGNDTTGYSTNFGGDVAYLSNSQTHPFNLIYSGGYLAGNVNQGSSTYQNLVLSQTIPIRRWTIVLDDAVSYLPQTGTVGLSGIPGVGDGGIPPVDTGADAGQTILTQNSNRVTNTLSGSFQRPVTGKTSLNGFGSYGVIRFTDDSPDNGIQGIDNTSETAGGGFSHRIDALSSYNASYNYTNFSFSGAYNYSLASQSVNFGYTRQFTRKVFLNASLGPQRTSSIALSAPSYTLAANVALSYSGEFSTYTAAYNSGTNNGSGVATGATFETLSGTISRPLSRAWHGSVTMGFNRSSNLPLVGSPSFTTNAFIGSGQVNRAVGRNLSVFISYTAQQQNLTGSVQSTNTLDGLSQVFAFGFTYAPASHHLGRR
jgi:hypothetical protein